MPDDAQVDPSQTIAALRRELETSAAERDEALAQQAAISEVLQIINTSPGDLAPVFDAILEKAHTLCGAAHGVFVVRDGEEFRPVAIHGDPRFVEGWRQVGSMRAPEGGVAARLMCGERVVHIVDAMDYDSYPVPSMRGLIEAGGIRTMVTVPLGKDNELLGIIGAFRQEVRPFSDKQIALLQNFAAQAVIAIENARLLTETREALEQQTATSEVLQVINSSPGDLTPVFETVLEKATSLCEASFGVLSRIDGENFSAIAIHGAPSALAEAMRQPRRIVPGNAHYRLMQGEDVVQVEDITAEDVYRSGNAARRALADVGGARSALWVALRKDDAALGAFIVYRQEVRPFSDKQIALLQNFAAQAVIAMENARLLTETREALEQQTATAEVLQVINSSPGDLAPVFDAMLEKALHLCEAGLGLLHIYDGKRFRALAIGGVSGSAAESLREWVPDPDSALQRIVDGELVVHIPDVVDTEAYRSGVASRRKLVELTGARTALWVACAKTIRSWGSSSSTAGRCARSPTSKSRYCRTLRRRRSSRWRMRGC
jgi:GAF domain-containing protein